MVKYHVTVEYNGQEILFNDFVMADTPEKAEEEACHAIYNDGLYNPYLREVDNKLVYYVIEA